MIPNLHPPEKHTAGWAKGSAVSEGGKGSSCGTSGGQCTAGNTRCRKVFLQDYTQNLTRRTYSRISSIFQGYFELVSPTLH